MNVEELSMIGPSVDLDTVESIHQKRLIAFLNHFFINTASFLNNFSLHCEQKCFDLEYKIQKLESSIIIIESKLNSVPGLDVPVQDNIDNKIESIPESVEVKPVEVVTSDIIVEEVMEVVEEKPILDECYMKFVKMLQFGVPPPAVKLKMSQEGISDDVFDLVLKCAHK